MEYRHLGRTGIKVSVLSYGAWVTHGNTVDEDLAYKCMKLAYDRGCNFFDNAEIYMNGKAEEVMGAALKRMFKDDGIFRESLVVTTKVFFGTKIPGQNTTGLSRKHIIEGVNASLKRLDLPYVDVVFCHRPDPNTPVEETVRAMNWLIEQGKAFYWGTSEWSAERIQEAITVAKELRMIPPCCEQPQYNVLHRTRFEQEYEPLYKSHGYGTTIWSPLASGVLTGKYSSFEDVPADSRLANSSHAWLREQLTSGKGINGLEEKDPKVVLQKVDKLIEIAKKLDCTVAQLCIAWCIKNQNVSTVITGASKLEQVQQNFDSINVVGRMTDEIMQQIEDVVQNKPKPHSLLETVWPAKH